MRTATLLLAALIVSAPTAAQQLVCGGHRVTDASGSRVMLDVDRDPLARPAEPQPAWMTVRDRELWDALVFDAYDSSGPQGDLPLEQRRTRTVSAGDLRSVDVCLPRRDENVTGERVAPYANEQWWQRHIERWTGLPWRGSVTIDCGIRLFGIIRVTEGDPEQIDEDVLATAYTNRTLGRWLGGEIEFNPDNLPRAEDFQVEVALARELGHLLGMWHTEPGTGFVMDAHLPTSPASWPTKERDLAQLAREVGPGVDYPGLASTTSVPALPLAGLLILGAVLMACGIHGFEPRSTQTLGPPQRNHRPRTGNANELL